VLQSGHHWQEKGAGWGWVVPQLIVKGTAQVMVQGTAKVMVLEMAQGIV
jgi:hypothetical protein